jgi:hypothetical protein
LAATRNELAGQRRQLELQNEANRRQGLENTFFRLLQLFSDVLEAIEIRGPSADFDSLVRGHSCFVEFLKVLRSAQTSEEIVLGGGGRLGLLKRVYAQHLRDNEPRVSAYYNNLGSILRFLATSGIEKPDWYASLLRAQVSDSEQVLLLYHALSDGRDGELRALIQRFDLLAGIPESKLLDPSDLNLLGGPA